MTVAGIVLAGGRSRRFGAPKLDVELDGRSILARAIDAVADVASPVIVALGPDDQRDVPTAAAGRRIVTHDPGPGGGPLVGIEVALRAAAQGSSGHAIVVAGDMPWLAPAVLRALLARLDEPGVTGVVPVVDGWPRPLPCAVDVAVGHTAAVAALAAGERSLRAWLDRLVVTRLPESAWRPLDPTGATFRDVDLPADLVGDLPADLPADSQRAGD
jgi:molybdopterin-guanine dinucleotide biosynthesis protein A